jgi:hypothetical protein
MIKVKTILFSGLALCLLYACKKDNSTVQPAVPAANTTTPPSTNTTTTAPQRPNYIIAGDSTDTNIVFTSFSPYHQYITAYGNPVLYTVDMNGDGEIDFSMHEYEDHAMQGLYFNCQSSISTGSYGGIYGYGWDIARDPANPQYIRIFHLNDTIDVNNQWVSPGDNTPRVFIGDYWAQYNFQNGVGSTLVASGGLHSNVSDAYIALRRKIPDSGGALLYAWVKYSIYLSGSVLVTDLKSSGVLKP